MADIPKDMGTLVKTLANAECEGTEDIHHISEMLRTLHMDVAQVDDIVEYEIRSALQSFDHGSSKRARIVTRPLRQMQSMEILCGRRAVAMYKTYLKQFDEEISRKRARTGRRFDPEK